MIIVSVPGDARREPVHTRFEIAQTVILEAGALANEYFGRLATLTVKSKGSHDLVSEADVQTEILIRDRLQKHFPEDGFLGEESGHTSLKVGSGVWVVDPIDGTQPFLSGLPNWCVAIAYVLDNKVEFGLVYNPPCNELFSGGKEFPATVNGRPIAVHPGPDLSAGMVSIGYSARLPYAFLFTAFSRLLEQKGMFFRNGSGALSLAYVAGGRLLGHVEPHMHPWDCLAAMAIIQAAGGRVNEFEVRDALLRGTRVVAGSPAVFDQLESLLD